MSNTIRRDIHPQIKVIDAKKGTVEYVASSQALDSANEVISAKGWKFDRFQKNAPFVDSHNYGSIDCLLGRVIDFAVKGGNLVETVQWAIDVPQNTLAQKGFAMTQAGYLKAVSVGFIPTKMVTRYDQTGTWDESVKDLGLGDLEDSINCIYLEQQQLELSACCIGANPDALAKAYKDGILEDSDLFQAFADALGLDFTLNTSRRQLKATVEYVIQHSGLMFVLDESHFLFPARFSTNTPPMRLNWLRTQLVDKQCPVVMVSTPQEFDRCKTKFIKATSHKIEQFLGRVMHNVTLPNELEQADLLAVAKIHFPDLDEDFCKSSSAAPCVRNPI